MLHTTFNPYEPGVVRIHLVPSKFSWTKSISSIAILNGHDIIPIKEAWTILLAIFIEEVNQFAGKEIKEEDINQIIENTVVKLQKVYGKRIKEELIRSDLWEIIDTFQNIAVGKESETTIRPISIGKLNTNGVLLTKELCKKLYEASLDSVQITLYSNEEEIHNQLVGVANYEKTIQGIKNAIEAGINVSVNTPLCKVNSKYKETLMFLKELGVKYVSCSGLIVTGNAKKETSKQTQLESEELYKVLTEAVAYCNENLIEISFTSPGWIESEKIKKLGLDIPSCGACLSNMAVSPNGEVMPCQSWLNEEGKLGNILKTPWKQIWNNSLCKKIRKNASKMEGICPLRNENNKLVVKKNNKKE